MKTGKTFEKSLFIGGVIGLVVIVYLICGCGIMTQSQVCEEAPANSLICRLIPNPEVADIALQLINLELLKNNAVAAEDVMAFFDYLEGAVDNSGTYALLASYIISKTEDLAKSIGEEVVIASGLIVPFIQKEILISDFDRKLIRIHIARQKTIIERYID